MTPLLPPVGEAVVEVASVVDVGSVAVEDVTDMAPVLSVAAPDDVEMFPSPSVSTSSSLRLGEKQPHTRKQAKSAEVSNIPLFIER